MVYEDDKDSAVTAYRKAARDGSNRPGIGFGSRQVVPGARVGRTPVREMDWKYLWKGEF
jgi:hypothetical protein